MDRRLAAFGTALLLALPALAVAQEAEPSVAAAEAAATTPEGVTAPTDPLSTDEATAEGEEVEEPEPQPRIVVAEPIHDLGKLRKGELSEVDFLIENQGDADLEIRDARPSCGCTVVSFQKKIEPGESGRVRAKIDTQSLSGAVAKSITLVTNDLESPKVVLTLRAEVMAYVSIAPVYARVVQVRTLAPTTTTVRVWSDELPALELLSIEPTAEWIEASFHRATAEEAAADADRPGLWIVEASLDPEAPLGPVTEQLRVTTNHPLQPLLEIPLTGFVRPVLATTPETADFGRVGPRAPKDRFVLKLFNFGETPVEVRGAETDLDFVTVEVSPEQDGRRYRVVLHLAPDAPKGKFQGTLRVETSSEVMPTVEVPVRGRIG